MSLRVAIRNWLLKPGKKEMSGDPAAVKKAGTLVYGHIGRELQLEVSEGADGFREVPTLPEGWHR